MGNEAAYQALCDGHDAFKAWRRENPTASLDFRGLDLSGAVFDGCFLMHADFSDANLVGASFNHCDLSRSNLSRANLSHANMAFAVLNEATAVDSIFIGACLEEAQVTGVTLTRANLTEVKATKATFEASQLQDCVFRNSALRSTRFASAQAQRADFTGADLSESVINFASTDDACFERARLTRTNCGEAPLSGLNFRYADLSVSNLSGCDLSYSDISYALLDHATLTKADLSNAIISHTSFREAHIKNTIVKGIRGIVDAKLLDTTHVHSLGAMHLHSCEIGPLERYCSWEFLRTAGRLPLFGASYSTLILIPLVMYVIAAYNDKVELLRQWSAALTARAPMLPGDPVSRFAETINNRLQPLESPGQSLILLASTLLLAVASTLYTFFCPPRIKEFSSHVWHDQFNRSLLHYWPFSWAHRRLRVACGACYAIGAAGALYVLAVKVMHAGVYIWNHSQFRIF